MRTPIEGLSKRSLWLIAGAFVATRLVLGFFAINPEYYGAGNEGLSNDVYNVYQGWAEAVIDRGEAPYSGTHIEYPPGSLPFVLLPEAMSPDDYELSFVQLMLLVDLAGLAGLLSLARRGGSLLGVWIWIVGLPLLGPLAYVRLDLVPAVLSIWGFERASAGRWNWSGAFLGYAVLTKIYPLLLLPALLVRSPHKKAFAAGAGLAVALPLLPLVGSIEDMLLSVGGHHFGRGIQIESAWGSGLLLGRVLGRPIDIVMNYGAIHVAGYPQIIETLSGALTLGVVLLGAWIVGRSGDAPASKRADVALATLLLAMGLATVLSPQFIVWAVAAAAVAACSSRTQVRFAAVSLLGIAALTQWVFPFLYGGIFADQTNTFGLGVLITRNIALIYVALEAAFSVIRSPDPSSGVRSAWAD